MQQKRVQLDLLVLDPDNARLHKDESVDGIKASLSKFGQVEPVVVSRPYPDGKMIVLAGNGTVQAARRLEWDSIYVVVSDLEAADATAYSIADNQTGLLSQFDNDLLAAEIAGFSDELIEALGFTESDLAELCEIGDGVVTDVDAPPVLDFDAYSVRVEGIKAEDFNDVMAIVSDVLSSYDLKAESK